VADQGVVDDGDALHGSSSVSWEADGAPFGEPSAALALSRQAEIVRNRAVGGQEHLDRRQHLAVDLLRRRLGHGVAQPRLQHPVLAQADELVRGVDRVVDLQLPAVDGPSAGRAQQLGSAPGARLVEGMADLGRALGLGDDHPEIGHAEIAQHDRQIGAPDLDQGLADVAQLGRDLEHGVALPGAVAHHIGGEQLLPCS
jgi:hypothetical protein